ncbi:two-partner secretion domain-containing protein [Acinetobacter baumannii]
MNKNSYRIIYSKARQMFVAVAENVRSQTKTSGQSEASAQSNIDNTESQAFHQLWQVKALVASISLWMPLAPVYAGIVADSAANAANRAVIGAGKNSAGTVVPVVNIQTPKNGISHNIYKQFDVLAEGAVLNNSRQGATTKTVGNVAANPFLATGEARVILNEVNSSAASRFEGNLEVAGQMADVIIANPSGISIKGGGFINANKAIFTTGKPQLNADGSIKQFTVDQGKITVSANPNSKFGLGGNNNDANYVDLYARALELSAELRAKNDIQVIAGANNVSADLQDVTAKTGTGTAPTLAVDVKALGGMYANNIYLMGTEKGLGVTNAGTIQAVNNLVITSAGKIEHSGTISSTSKTQGLVNIQTTGTGAAGDINNSGTISGKGIVNLDSANDLNITAKEVKIDEGNNTALILAANGNINLKKEIQLKNSAVDGGIYLNANNINLEGNATVDGKADVNIVGKESILIKKNNKIKSGKSISILGDGLSLEGSELTSGQNVNLQNSSVNKKLLINDSIIKAEEDYNFYSNGDLSINKIDFSQSKDNLKKQNIKVGSGGILDLGDNFTFNSKGGGAFESRGNINLGEGLKLNLDGDISFISTGSDIKANTLNLTSNVGGVYFKSNGGININSKITEKKVLNSKGVETGQFNQEVSENYINAFNDISIDSNIGVYLNGANFKTNFGDFVVKGKDLNIDVSKYGYHTRFDYMGQELYWYANSNNKNNFEANNILFLVDNSLRAVSGKYIAKKNINLFSNGSFDFYVNDLNSNGHTNIQAKNKLTIKTGFNGKDVFDNQYISGSNDFKSDGLISILGSSVEVDGFLSATGGAILINSLENYSNSDKGLHLYLTSNKNDFLEKNSSLKNLNGTIDLRSTGGVNFKTNKIKAYGDISLYSNGGVVFNKGSDYNQDDVRNKKEISSENGAINISADYVDLNAARLKSKNGISIVANKGDISLNSKKETLNDINIMGKFTESYGDPYSEFELFKKNNPDYKKKLDDLNYHIYLTRYGVSGKGAGQKRIDYANNEINNAEKEIVNLNNAYGVTNLYNRYKLLFSEYAVILGKKRFNYYFEDFKQVNENIDYSDLNFSGYLHRGVDLLSDGNINLISNNGIILNSANVNTLGDFTVYAKGKLDKKKTAELVENQLDSSIVFANVKDQYELGRDNENYYQKIDITKPNNINAKNVNLIANDQSGLNLILQGTDIKAADTVNIVGSGNIDFRHNVDNIYTKTQQTTTKESLFGLKKSSTTETRILEGVIGKSDVLKANKINIESLGGSISLYGTQIQAPKDQVKLKAAKDIYMVTFQDQINEVNTIKKDAGFLGLEYRDSNSVGSKIVNNQIPTVITGRYIASSSGGSTYLEGTQFNFTEGVSIKVGDGPNPSEDAKLVINSAKGLYSNSQDNNKKNTFWQSMESRGTVEELANLPKFNGPVNNIKIDGNLSVQVPIKQGENSEVIDIINNLSKEKGYEYLKTLIDNKDKNVNWTALELTKKNWDYKQQGLTPAGAAILTIIVTALTAGAGSSAAGALGFSTTGVASSMAQAAITSLSTQASISLINNGGNVAATLRELGSDQSIRNLVASIATAGALKSISVQFNLPETSTAFNDRLYVAFVNSTSSSIINSAINGGSLSDNLEASLLAGLSNSLQAEFAQNIGLSLDIKDPTVIDSLLHKIAHIASGCVTGAIQKQCEAGAIGAGVGEIVAGMIEQPNKDATAEDISKYQEKVINTSKLISGSLASLAGYDAGYAASSASLAVSNNYLTSKNYRDLKTNYDTCIKGGGSVGKCSGAMIAAAETISKTNDTRLRADCVNATSNACINGIKDLFEGERTRNELNKVNKIFYNSEYSKFNSWPKFNSLSKADTNIRDMGSLYSTFEKIDFWQKTNCNGISTAACQTKYKQYLDANEATRVQIAGGLDRVKSMPVIGNTVTVGDAVITLITGTSLSTNDPSRLVALAEIASVGITRYIPQVGPVVHVAQPKYAGQRYTTASLTSNKDATINPDTIRAALVNNRSWLKASYVPEKVSIAVAKVETKSGTDNILAVSGPAWNGNAPTDVVINGVKYKVVTTDSHSVQPITYTVDKNGKPITNNNHAEAKLFSYIKDSYSSTPSKVTMSIQNTASEPAGMCNGCLFSSGKYFTNEVPFMRLSIFHGTTGKN